MNFSVKKITLDGNSYIEEETKSTGNGKYGGTIFKTCIIIHIYLYEYRYIYIGIHMYIYRYRYTYIGVHIGIYIYTHISIIYIILLCLKHM